MNQNEFIPQYGHTWRVFESLVQDFEAEAWLQMGRGVITPARLALHILLGTQYYLEDQTPFEFPSGKPFDPDWQNVKTDDLPTQNDILAFSREITEKTEQWLFDLEYGAGNKSFPWAGDTQLGVVIFLLRHTLFHLGELSSLLNESKHGQVADHYVAAI
ncbi:MAG: DinB family protein [Chloroflexi bacterium]|nr:DinB family protein [Chloroflexota bacterium]